MYERLKKINNVCGIVCFVLLLIMVINTLITAISTPWIDPSLTNIGQTSNFYVNVYLTNMSWALFVFAVLGVGVSCVNFFTKNKFKYVETIYFAGFFIFITVVTILLKPFTFTDDVTPKAEMISAFGVLVFEIFIIAFYLVSRALQFWKFKQDADVLKDTKNKKTKMILAIICLALAVLSLGGSLTLFILPHKMVGDKLNIEFNENNSEVYLTNNSDKVLDKVYISYDYEDTYYERHRYYSYCTIVKPGEKASYYASDADENGIQNLKVFYEIENFEGAMAGALSLLPIALISTLFAVQLFIPCKEKGDKKYANMLLKTIK